MKLNNTPITYNEIRQIATCMNISYKAVYFVAKGERGKRKTPLQEAVKEAIALRIKQNNQLAAKCKQLAIEKLTPTNQTV